MKDPRARYWTACPHGTQNKLTKSYRPSAQTDKTRSAPDEEHDEDFTLLATLLCYSARP